MNIETTEDLALALNDIREKVRVYRQARKSYKKKLQKEFKFQLNSKTIEYKFHARKKSKSKSAEHIFTQFLQDNSPLTISTRRRSTGSDTPVYNSRTSA